MTDKPEFPPNRIEVLCAPWQRCFWLAHVYRWEMRGRTYAQQVCIHCGETGETQRAQYDPPPTPPVCVIMVVRFEHDRRHHRGALTTYGGLCDTRLSNRR